MKDIVSKLPKEVAAEIEEKRRKGNELLSASAARDGDAIYEKERTRDYRSNYGRDIDTVLNNVFYSRFADKTQVHSFYKNDDLTRRCQHVQLVSRIARTIGETLGLNLELIEAIALGHDIGHTPFGHRGETFLSDLYYDTDKKYFNHNVHSVRALRTISKQNLSLQTLDGIISHNGEYLVSKIEPTQLATFEEFDIKLQSSYVDKTSIASQRANTLEGALVRIVDIIAYVGKDRQDLYKINQQGKLSQFTDFGIGLENRQIIANVSQSLIANSYGKNYISLGEDVAAALKKMKEENFKFIYKTEEVVEQYDKIQVLFNEIFNAALKDLATDTDRTYIKRHFVQYNLFEKYKQDYLLGMHSNGDVVVDYIASMTDDYFIDLSEELQLKNKINYTGYFKK